MEKNTQKDLMNLRIDLTKNIEKFTTEDLNEPRFTLRNDYAFKKVFGSSTKQRPLIDLLSLILDFPKEEFEEVKIENPFLENEFYDDKKGILDIKLTLKDGKKINIEMQNRWESGYIKRTLYYWSKRYFEDIKESQGYDTLNPCIFIHLLNQKFMYGDKIHSTYQIMEKDDHTFLENLLELHFLDLTKIEEKHLGELEKWLLFIKTDERSVREMLARDNAVMQEANTTLGGFYTNNEERRKYEAAERYTLDRNTLFYSGKREGLQEGMQKGMQQGMQKGMQQGMQKGMQQGMQKGVEKGKFEIIRNMRSKGLSDEDILNLTGISKDVLIKL